MPAASVSQLFAPCRFGFSGETKNVCGIMKKKITEKLVMGRANLISPFACERVHPACGWVKAVMPHPGKFVQGIFSFGVSPSHFWYYFKAS